MGNVDITIVLATCNRAPMLRKALKSLVQQETGGKFSYDILVIDDGSTDDTAAVVRESVGCCLSSIHHLCLSSQCWPIPRQEY